MSRTRQQIRCFRFAIFVLVVALTLLVTACDPMPTPTPTNTPSTTPSTQEPTATPSTTPSVTEEPLVTPTPNNVVRLGWGNEPDQQFLTGVLKQILVEAGWEVEVLDNLRDTRAARMALEAGEIDGYWEFTHTALTNQYDRQYNFDDSQDLFNILNEKDASDNLKWFRPIRANNPLIMIIRTESDNQNRLFTLSDLADSLNDQTEPEPVFCTPQFFFPDGNEARALAELKNAYDISSWRFESYSNFIEVYKDLIENDCAVVLTRRQTYDRYLALNPGDDPQTRTLQEDSPIRFFPTDDHLALVFRQDALNKIGQLEEQERFRHRLNCMAELLNTDTIMQYLDQPPGNQDSNDQNVGINIDEDLVNRVFECDRAEEYSIVIEDNGNIEQQLLSEIVLQTLIKADIPAMTSEAPLTNSESEEQSVEAHVWWGYEATASISISPSDIITTSIITISYENPIILAVDPTPGPNRNFENLETFQHLFNYMVPGDTGTGQRLAFCIEPSVQEAYDTFIETLIQHYNYPSIKDWIDLRDENNLNPANCDVIIARAIGGIISQAGFRRLESVEGLPNFPDEEPVMFWNTSEWQRLRTEAPLTAERLTCLLAELNEGTMERLIESVSEGALTPEVAIMEEFPEDFPCPKPPPGIICDDSLLENGSFEHLGGWVYSDNSSDTRPVNQTFALHGERVLQLGIGDEKLEELLLGTPPHATATITVTIPSTAISLHLQLAYYPIHQDVSGKNTQRIDFFSGPSPLDSQERPKFLSVNLPLRPLYKWSLYMINLSPFLNEIAGQTVKITFQVIIPELEETSESEPTPKTELEPTLIYIDDVRLETCFIQEDS